ncbi:MAG: TIGR02206 family membrane protein [Woeseia sp.]|nr:TIGR02206 family membrane protein [Woeseia sp.]
MIKNYFANDYEGPAFELFGEGHLVALAIIAAIITWLIVGWRNPSEVAKRRGRYVLFGAILVVQIVYFSWLFTTGAWDVRENLPLHVCSFSIYGSMYVLATRSYRVYEVIFFFGIVGAAQAVLTPSVGEYGLPHFRAVQTLVAHGLIIIALVYMTVIEGFRPTFASVWKSLLALNLLMVPVTGVNLLLGSNYMFTLAKPATASLFDLLGPWPWYLLATEFVALGLFLLLYLPFIFSRDKKQSDSVS